VAHDGGEDGGRQLARAHAAALDAAHELAVEAAGVADDAGARGRGLHHGLTLVRTRQRPAPGPQAASMPASLRSMAPSPQPGQVSTRQPVMQPAGPQTRSDVPHGQRAPSAYPTAMIDVFAGSYSPAPAQPSWRPA